MHPSFLVGQRWISASEPELGLGVVTAVEHRRVQLRFPLRAEERVYMTENAPLHRYMLNVGDIARDKSGQAFRVTRIAHNDGLVTYMIGDGAELPEVRLHPLVELRSVRQRILAAQPEPNAAFELRRRTFEQQHVLGRSRARGFIGARVELLGHQLSIAQRVSERMSPRVLLADEVGLGKTIEAGLILHAALLSGTVRRALIVVPDSLLHQWLVELLRKFTISATLMDRDRYDAIAADAQNPFDAEQIILTPLSLITGDMSRANQAAAADFDLLIVDEAHRLGWSPEAASPEYSAIEHMAAVIPSVLLLSATPEQRGMDGHFARLRLLDPKRFHDLEAFRAEQENFEALGTLIDALLVQPVDAPIADNLLAEVGDRLGNEWTARLKEPDAHAMDQTVRALLDRFGTGRVLFRNTRRHVGGFPDRVLHPHPLDDDGFDEKLNWLVGFLRDRPREKALLIAHTADVAEQLEEVLRRREAISCAAFHEGMSLVNRDRAAAYFASDENGAQILLCSEIGGEGRNFQFARHLVLFDLPADPDLVEQRIGRLDRIGRTAPVDIHIPYGTGSRTQHTLRWLDEGVGAFSAAGDAGARLFAEFGGNLNDENVDLEDLIHRTQTRRNELIQRQRVGRDRLLEIHSFDRAQAADLERTIEHAQDVAGLMRYVTAVCDYIGLELEPQSDHTTILRPSDHQLIESIAGLPEDGMTATLSRSHATRREDLDFLSWEHPVVRSMMHAVIDEGLGRLAVASSRETDEDPGTVLVEALYTLDIPGSVRLDRFLDDPLLRSIMAIGADAPIADQIMPAKLDPVERVTATEVLRRIREELGATLDTMEEAMGGETEVLIAAVRERVKQEFDVELERLRALKKVNDAVRPIEIELLEDRRSQVLEQLDGARLQVEALRVIICL